MKIGATADLHFGIDPDIDRRVRTFIEERIRPAALDLLVIAGDLAETEGLAPGEVGRHHETVLHLLRGATAGTVAFCAGNHDLWASPPEIDSRALYEERLAAVAEVTGTVYLDRTNLQLDDLCVVGCYGHFDFSLRVPDLLFSGQPVGEEHYRRQTPPGYAAPVWMDGLRIRWEWDDREACEAICAWGMERMKAALKNAANLLFVSHGVPRNEINAHTRSPNMVSRFLNAFSGTLRLEEMIRFAAAREARILAVSGHTHRHVARRRIEGVDYVNIGGNYGTPRLEIFRFPEGT